LHTLIKEIANEKKLELINLTEGLVNDFEQVTGGCLKMGTKQRVYAYDLKPCQCEDLIARFHHKMDPSTDKCIHVCFVLPETLPIMSGICNRGDLEWIFRNITAVVFYRQHHLVLNTQEDAPTTSRRTSDFLDRLRMDCLMCDICFTPAEGFENDPGKGECLLSCSDCSSLCCVECWKSMSKKCPQCQTIVSLGSY